MLSPEVFYYDPLFDPQIDAEVWAKGEYPKGWYWAYFTRCMPDPHPLGPFESRELAENDARGDNVAFI